jgi:hypothetical protein
MKKLLKSLKGFIFSVFLTISLALKRIDDDLRADPIDLFRTEQRDVIRSLFSKFEAGVADEAYVQYFYEILKKADKFIRTTNPDKIMRTAAKHGMYEFGLKDQWGLRYEHYGFYDEKHKHSGKTMIEAREAEMAEKILKDDDYPIQVIYYNKREFSFTEATGLVRENETELQALEIHEMERARKFPLTIVREAEAVNKIEQLTEYIHVKQISSKHKLLEFFIPKKFRLHTLKSDHPIFKELINIKQVWFKDEYGDKNAYTVTEFYKMTEYNPKDKFDVIEMGFDVLKFKAEDIVEIK